MVIASSDEVARGKPEPDVYLLASERLGVDPGRTLAIEDSDPGIRAAVNAGMHVVALPNPSYRPRRETLADLVIDSWGALDRAWLDGDHRRST